MMKHTLLLSIALTQCLIGSVSAFAPQSVLSNVPAEGFLAPRRRLAEKHCFAHLGVSDDDGDNIVLEEDEVDRRAFLSQLLTGSMASVLAASTVVVDAPSSHAVGLVQFPCTTPLMNTYHVMRGGTTLLEEEDIWSTNPLFLTNREAALSERGIAEVQATCRLLEEANVNPSVIKYSLAASAMDTTSIVRDELKVGQNRVVPEFTFMDPRAIGKWDMMSYSQTLPAVIAMDDGEAGKNGLGGRPPPNDDGTPNDTLADQAIRLRQLLSILETQYSGDTILLVFPDGSGPALLSCMIAGIGYDKAHELEFAAGEVRLDVTMQSTLDLYQAQQEVRQKAKANKDEYAATLQSGKAELKRLRSLDLDTLVSKKDEMIEQERQEIDEGQRQREEARKAREDEEREARLTRQREMEDERLRQRGIDPTDMDARNNGSIPPVVIGASLSAFVAVALSGGGGEDDGKPVATNATDTLDPNRDALVDATNIGVQASTPTGPLIMNDVSFGDTITERGSSTHGKSKPSLYDNTLVEIEGDRLDAAQQAMQNYLDQDDGADAWLSAMASIIDEDEEDNIIDVEPTESVNGSGDLFEQNIEN